ncbi:MAG: TIGR00282 family metallophosphoesterase [bacterium]|nr:TIGR00282 family metallophosphoesterase [bacterium]
MQNRLSFLFIGDIIGKAGRNALSREMRELKEKYNPDLIIANGENLAGGFGMTKSTVDAVFASGVDILTSGNHIWDNKEFAELLKDERIMRPLNYHPSLPGRGYNIFRVKDIEVCVANLCGRIFMQPLDCPFRKMDELLEKIKTKIVIVDFHAEATAEKQAFAYYLDGRVSAVIGTHTHCQTADERILKNKTAFITDVGLTGSTDSIIGFEPEGAIRRTLLQVSQRFEVAKEMTAVNAVFFQVDAETGEALSIERIFKHAKD